MSFDSRTDAFVQWLQKSGVNLSDKFTIEDRRSEGQGRLVMAACDIAEDDILFSIPRHALLNVESCSLVENVPQIKETLLAAGQWDALVAVLIYEWKSASRWLPYLEVLPLKETGHKLNQLMFWLQDELNKLLPSLVVSRVGRDAALEMYERYVKLAQTYDLPSVTLEEFDVAATVIQSYSFDVEKAGADGSESEDDESDEEGESVAASLFLKSMVPLADTLNADTKLHNASLVYSDDILQMRAVKNIAKGDQIYNTYSDHPNAELLRRYGYVETSGSAHDFGEISLATIVEYFSERSSLSKDTLDETLKILREIEESEGETFVLDTYDFFLGSNVIFEFTFLVQLLTVVSAVNEQKSTVFASYATKLRCIRRMYKKCYQLLESSKVTSKFINHYTSIVERRLALYPKSAKSKVEEPKLGILSRLEMAAIVLRSEYEALLSCADASKVYASMTVIDDDKLVRNIMKADIFQDNDGARPAKKAKT